MLLIISEDLADEYEKVKSKTKPKTFEKANIRCGKKDMIIVQRSTRSTLVRIAKSWLLLLKRINNTMAHTRKMSITWRSS